MSHWVDNLKRAKWTLGGLFLAMYIQHRFFMKHLQKDYFGRDGNGGDMLKIWTLLTDQEMAYLKVIRRTPWHAVQMEPNRINTEQSTITDQELSNRGINLPREPYVEYNKRPPHDFYL